LISGFDLSGADDRGGREVEKQKAASRNGTWSTIFGAAMHGWTLKLPFLANPGIALCG
jgi:hypothetical protein